MPRSDVYGMKGGAAAIRKYNRYTESVDNKENKPLDEPPLDEYYYGDVGGFGEETHLQAIESMLAEEPILLEIELLTTDVIPGVTL